MFVDDATLKNARASAEVDIHRNGTQAIKMAVSPPHSANGDYGDYGDYADYCDYKVNCDYDDYGDYGDYD
jgi:hypothetical protein